MAFGTQLVIGNDGNARTQYTYDSSTGELTEINYYRDETPDPDTPAVSFTYNRLGQQATVTDAVGTRTFTYNAALQLATESIDDSSGGLYDAEITRQFQDWGTPRGRDMGFTISTSQEPSAYEVYYYYSNQGRLEMIWGTGLAGGYGATMENSWLADSDLLSRRAFASAYFNYAQTDYAYEENRDVLTEVHNQKVPVQTTFSKYTYANDELARRASVVRTGPAFDIEPPNEGFIDLYGYNNRSELTATNRHEWTETGGPGDQLDPYGDYDYLYDNIGNRQTYTLDTATTYYCATDLNQYKYVGSTTPNCASVTPNLQYDDDGNLTDDGVYKYTWDAENRLVCVAPPPPAVSGDKKLEFRYDYMGRRVEKVYLNHNGTTWVEQSTERFVYDGWNVVLVLNENNDTVRKYTWGLDMSQSIHGAGGIGGLLACVETQGTSSTEDDERYWFFYDANGNVSQILDATDPNSLILAARYEYDPYGNEVTIFHPTMPAYQEVNPIRFSTKWLDTELTGSGDNGAIGKTGLYNFGYRYYSPRLGRWLNRDPIEEFGGLDLYAFVANQPISGLDILGLLTQAQCINYWRPFFSFWLTNRSTRNTYDDYVKNDTTDIQGLLQQRANNEISEAEFMAEFRELCLRKLQHWRTYHQLNQSLQDGFSVAMLARWMVDVGCACEGACQATIAVKNTRGFKKAFDIIQRIPTGYSIPEVAMYILENSVNAKPGKGIWSMMNALAWANLHVRIRQCCVNGLEISADSTQLDYRDLYEERPQIDTFADTVPKARPLQ